MSALRALVVADTQGILRMWSSGAEVLFGHPAADTLGRSVELLIPERFRELHWRAFHPAMATGVIEIDEVITPRFTPTGPRSTMRFAARGPRSSNAGEWRNR